MQLEYFTGTYGSYTSDPSCSILKRQYERFGQTTEIKYKGSPLSRNVSYPFTLFQKDNETVNNKQAYFGQPALKDQHVLSSSSQDEDGKRKSNFVELV